MLVAAAADITVAAGADTAVVVAVHRIRRI